MIELSFERGYSCLKQGYKLRPSRSEAEKIKICRLKQGQAAGHCKQFGQVAFKLFLYTSVNTGNPCLVVLSAAWKFSAWNDKCNSFSRIWPHSVSQNSLLLNGCLHYRMNTVILILNGHQSLVKNGYCRLTNLTVFCAGRYNVNNQRTRAVTLKLAINKCRLSV